MIQVSRNRECALSSRYSPSRVESQLRWCNVTYIMELDWGTWSYYSKLVLNEIFKLKFKVGHNNVTHIIELDCKLLSWSYYLKLASSEILRFEFQVRHESSDWIADIILDISWNCTVDWSYYSKLVSSEILGFEFKVRCEFSCWIVMTDVTSRVS